jgi:hypothetical protein
MGWHSDTDDTEHKEEWFVAVKIFLEHDGKLLIIKDKFNEWDLPGGRIRKDEFEKPLEGILKRKVTSELGEKVEYTLKGKPSIFMRHQRRERAPGNPLVKIFALGYEAEYLGGEIEFSSIHNTAQWVDIQTFKPEGILEGGWLKGVQEYLEMKRKA